MYRRCGAIVRPHRLGPQLRGLEPLTSKHSPSFGVSAASTRCSSPLGRSGVGGLGLACTTTTGMC
eukprot:20843-Pyramimonas_sp.AAC.1